MFESLVRICVLELGLTGSLAKLGDLFGLPTVLIGPDTELVCWVLIGDTEDDFGTPILSFIYWL